MRPGPATVAIIRRRSPDWAALAAVWRAGHPVGAAHFAPTVPAPDFPPDIAALVARWNATAAVDFFTVRARLKSIAEATLRAAPGTVQFEAGALPRSPPAGVRWVLFCDDDDWFAPDLATRLDACEDAADVLVFPFVRLGGQTSTFASPAALPAAAMGPLLGFPQRYHTNNYALAVRHWHAATLAAMTDHFDASAHGARAGFADRHCAAVIGATNKTPAAASFLRAALDHPLGVRGATLTHLAELRRHTLPAALAWMAPPIAQTVALLETVAATSVAPPGGAC